MLSNKKKTIVRSPYKYRTVLYRTSIIRPTDDKNDLQVTNKSVTRWHESHTKTQRRCPRIAYLLLSYCTY